MRDKKKKAREIPSRHVLYAIVLLCMLMIGATWILGNTNPVTDLIANGIIPMQTGLNELGGTLAEQLENLRTLQAAQEENRLLKEELAVLRSENSRLQEEHYELERLRELLGLQDEYSQYTMTAARIIHKDSGNWYHSFLIDKGSADGILEGCNVLAGGAEGGLVGIVTSVGENYARVRAIIDDTSHVGGTLLIGENGISCVVSGDLRLMTEEEQLRVDYIDKDITVEDGTKVLTSNLSSEYLPNILIGYVQGVAIGSDNLQQSGYLVPAVKFDNLREVMVILDRKVTETAGGGE
ncbi:MAG: rod shape-determining protein MreC [Lachnospiraceae bacterium]|jgi:rod shape-determining protein MreC|nr:rod shape-determining protein MreC [Lachnospiraceae bacterium]